MDRNGESAYLVVYVARMIMHVVKVCSTRDCLAEPFVDCLALRGRSRTVAPERSQSLATSAQHTLTLTEVSASERDQVEPARAASVAATQALQSIDKRVDSRF